MDIQFDILDKQPQGIKGEMRSYQLIGTSFLVHLFKNGLSGILGDEMGLVLYNPNEYIMTT